MVRCFDTVNALARKLNITLEVSGKLSDSEYHELSDYEYLDWDKLSSNPNDGAIELLKANPDDINWGRLSKNPNPSAIELLKTKMIEENEMYEDDYDNLDYYEKINWANLSSNANPEAIELLKENQRKINWYILSGNPAIFDDIIVINPNFSVPCAYWKKTK